ncbi:hydrogenase-4 component B [bacterium BMS3Bbin09]|nr:hydrogenase-4 component B [bacterium BMS3Bbin09]
MMMIGAMLFIPIITALLCFMMQKKRAVELVNLSGAAALCIAAVSPLKAALSAPLYFMGNTFFLDALSAYFMGIIVIISLLTAIYSIDYMGQEFREGLVSIREIRIYYALMHLFVFTMLLAAASNNIAIFWIAIEGTTLVSALLVGFYKNRQSIEAAWKYIILCTVSITFALLGIFIIYYASVVTLGGHGTMNWTELRDIAEKLNPATVKLAFIFILLGYGAKAGIAPVHNWLPDAHSQAPTPISALLSGVLLKCAFLGILRYVIIVNKAAGPLYSEHLLLFFGLLSMGLATAFILMQNNYKRLLAYSSIEHIGIIAVGIGIGGFWGIYGSLLHVLNHAVVKTLLFFTTGRVRLKYHSTKIDKVKGAIEALPVSGTVMLLAALAIAGAPPFNIFLSEFTIMKAAVDSGSWITFTLFIVFATVIFGAIVYHFGKMTFGKSEKSRDIEWNRISTYVIIIMAVVMLTLGIHLPSFLDSTLKSSVNIVMGGR